jgi:hypothetical protein
MSGGHWNYVSYRIEEWAPVVGDAMLMLAKLEHDVDWTESGDYSKERGKQLVYDRLVAFFEKHFGMSDLE